MNDQNAKQEPPKGYRLLTAEEMGHPIPKKAIYWSKLCQKWNPTDCAGELAPESDRHMTYAVPITPASTPADAPTDATGEAGEEVVHGFTLEPGETAADLPHWPEFAAHFEQKEGCKPHPRDSHAKLLFEYYVAGGAKEFSAGITALSEQRHTIATLRAECEADKARLDLLQKLRDDCEGHVLTRILMPSDLPIRDRIDLYLEVQPAAASRGTEGQG